MPSAHSRPIPLLAQIRSVDFPFMESFGHLFKFSEGHIYSSPTVGMLLGGVATEPVPGTLG